MCWECLKLSFLLEHLKMTECFYDNTTTLETATTFSSQLKYLCSRCNSTVAFWGFLSFFPQILFHVLLLMRSAFRFAAAEPTLHRSLLYFRSVSSCWRICRVSFQFSSSVSKQFFRFSVIGRPWDQTDLVLVFLAPSLFRAEVLKEDLGNREQLLARLLLAGAATITASIPCGTAAELLQTGCESFHNTQLFLALKDALDPQFGEHRWVWDLRGLFGVFCYYFNRSCLLISNIFFSFLTLAARFTSSIFFLECNKDAQSAVSLSTLKLQALRLGW